MKFQESVYSLGYPIYGARFLNDTVLLVTGGGGEGNNGIPNKLTALQVNFEKRKVIKRFRELTLDNNDDSPTTLDAANNIILMGCNESSAKIKAGQDNHHLRKYVFENDHLKFVASVDMDRSRTPEDYTKLTYMSQDGSVAAIASSKLPTVIRILNPALLSETYEIETGNDVKDLQFSPDGKVLSYITSSTLEVISIVTGRFIVRKTDFNENWALSKIRFIGEDTVVIAASLKKGNGIVLCKVSLKSGTTSVLKTKIVTTKIKGVTSMDVDLKGQLAALAGNDNSVLIVKLKSLTVSKFFKQVHSFAVTRVVFSPDGKVLASVSAANTIHAIRVPDNLAASTSFVEKLVKVLVNFVLMVALAAIVQVIYKHDLHQKTYRFALEKWSARNQPLSMIDEFRQTTLIGDVVSVETKTKAVPTREHSVTTPTFSTTTSETLTFTSEPESDAGADVPESLYSETLSSAISSGIPGEISASMGAVDYTSTSTGSTVNTHSFSRTFSSIPDLNLEHSASPTSKSTVEDLVTSESLNNKSEPTASGLLKETKVISETESSESPTTCVSKTSSASSATPSNVPLDADSLEPDTESEAALLSQKSSLERRLETTKLSSPAGSDREIIATGKSEGSAIESATPSKSPAFSKSAADVDDTQRESSDHVSTQTSTSRSADVAQSVKPSMSVGTMLTKKSSEEPKLHKAGSLTSKRSPTEDAKIAKDIAQSDVEYQKGLLASKTAAIASQLDESSTLASTTASTTESAELLVGISTTRDLQSSEFSASSALTSSWAGPSSAHTVEHVSSGIPDDFENKFTPDVSGQTEEVGDIEEATPDVASTDYDEPATVEELKPVAEVTAKTDNKLQDSAVEEPSSELLMSETGVSSETSKENDIEHDEL
ncbi:LAME_0H15126g1_1 [Lachancea meyersii CBS 8951]|uniref:Guanine nucleotide-exchange factor SEC12 n=1 Tax=Lachancea meyersii CBS 8951 TaxID=1266667 RepID=A0A1G4KHS6_9SACH|nr:LAME_0H15126g1_1 [Lachancea meyersii CBS 8951]